LKSEKNYFYLLKCNNTSHGHFEIKIALKIIA